MTDPASQDTGDDDAPDGPATPVDGAPRDLIVLRGLEGNPPAGQLNATQRLLAPHVPAIMVFWWIVWFVALGTMIWRYVGRPLLSRRRGPGKPPPAAPGAGDAEETGKETEAA